MTIGIEYPRPEENSETFAKLIAEEMEKNKRVENTKTSCFNCGKSSFEMNKIDSISTGRNSIQGDGNFRCKECNDRYVSHLQDQERLIKEDEQKNQQIANLETQN